MGVLADDVSGITDLEVVDQTDYVITFLAERHGIGLGDAVLAGQSLVLLGGDGFDGDFDAGDFVLADDHGVALSLVNLGVE